MAHSNAFYGRVGRHKRYLDTVAFIAHNDEPGDMNRVSIAGYISVITASEAFGITASTIACDVLSMRKNRDYDELLREAK